MKYLKLNKEISNKELYEILVNNWDNTLPSIKVGTVEGLFNNYILLPASHNFMIVCFVTKSLFSKKSNLFLSYMFIPDNLKHVMLNTLYEQSSFRSPALDYVSSREDEINRIVKNMLSIYMETIENILRENNLLEEKGKQKIK